MVRFIDLTEAYWTDGGGPICAFLSTVTDKFLESASGEHTFSCADDFDGNGELMRLVPPGFFEGKKGPAHCGKGACLRGVGSGLCGCECDECTGAELRGIYAHKAD
jgi:hypothetical protein